MGENKYVEIEWKLHVQCVKWSLAMRTVAHNTHVLLD